MLIGERRRINSRSAHFIHPASCSVNSKRPVLNNSADHARIPLEDEQAGWPHQFASNSLSTRKIHHNATEKGKSGTSTRNCKTNLVRPSSISGRQRSFSKRIPQRSRLASTEIPMPTDLQPSECCQGRRCSRRESGRVRSFQRLKNPQRGRNSSLRRDCYKKHEKSSGKLVILFLCFSWPFKMLASIANFERLLCKVRKEPQSQSDTVPLD